MGVRYLDLGLLTFLLIFLSRIVPYNGADFGMRAFFYFVILLLTFVFCWQPWERKNVVTMHVVLFLLLGLIFVVAKPVVLIVKSF